MNSIVMAMLLSTTAGRNHRLSARRRLRPSAITSTICSNAAGCGLHGEILADRFSLSSTPAIQPQKVDDSQE